MIPSQHDRSASYKILLVEDEGMVARMVTDWCRRALQTRSTNYRPCNSTIAIEWTPTCKLAEERAYAWHPDLIIMDMGLPDGCGAKLGLRIQEKLPDVRILGLSALKNERSVLWADRAHFHGFVLKSPMGVRELEGAIAAVAHGGTYFSAEYQALKLQILRSSNFHGHFLTDREAEVLELIAHGKDDAEIASELGLSAATAHKHRQSLLNKLEVHSTPKLVAKAHVLGYGTPVATNR